MFSSKTLNDFVIRLKPKFTYSGLTVVLSNQSRLDKDSGKLLSAGGGQLFDEFVNPQINRFQCDIRLKEDLDPLLPETKCILLCGEPAFKFWCKDDENHIGAVRGSVYYYDGRFTQQDCRIPMIPTFFPQDAKDKVDHESRFNPQLDEVQVDNGDEDDEDDTTSAKRRHGITARRNYRFWLQQDIKKAKELVRLNGIVPAPRFKPQYRVWPPLDEAIKVLMSAKNKDLFIDLETWYPQCNIKCVGFGIGMDGPIYVVPLYDHMFQWAYSNLHLFLRAFAIAIRDNQTIAHNGSNFDFPVLAHYYKIPWGKRLADTMIMSHRMYSDVEKSLGHMTSLNTWEPFHKDEGDCGYYTQDQVMQTLRYCGKDVYTMQLSYYEMMDRASKIPGMLQSFAHANAAIRPYMLMSMQGIHYKEEVRKSIMHENDRLMMQYLRMIRLLIGDKDLAYIAGKSKAGMPSSNPQCCRYFHELLGYPVVAKGEIRKDGSRAPSLGKKPMLKLRLKHDNPVIDLCLAYRECAKENGSLKFDPLVPVEQPLTQQQIVITI